MDDPGGRRAGRTGTGPADEGGHGPTAPPVDLRRFFHPETVAVIGASAVDGTPATALWRKIRAWGERAGATVIPVHLREDEVDGVACRRSILDIDAEVDLAVILVGDAVAAFETVVAAGARFAVVFGAGFAELDPSVDPAGAARQRRLEDLVAAGSTRLLGPNTNLNAFESFRDDLPGPRIALITQSGHQGRPVFEAQAQGIALSHWAPTGNEADLEAADFIRWFADQPEVGVVAAYIEGFKDGRTLIGAAEHAARAGVPIVCVKVGRTEAGASMARSHTGHLAGNDRVTDAVFRQHGIVRVDGLDELTDTAAALARSTTFVPSPRDGDRRPTGGRANRRNVCIYGISGGTGAHLADLCSAAGLDLPELAPGTQAELHRWIPPYLRVANPVDSGGLPSTDERGPRILEAIIADPAVDLVICPITGAVDLISRPLATDLVAAAATTDKPIFVVWGSPDGTDPVYTDVLLASSLPTFRTFGSCVRAARAWFEHGEFLARHRARGSATGVATVAGPAVAAGPVLPLIGTGPHSEHTAKRLLAASGIPVTRDILVTSATAAGRAARELGPPVVMKVCSPDLAHKSDAGLVAVDVRSAAQARATYAELLARAARTDPHATVEGVLVCEQVVGGVETVVGCHHDDLFGPTVVFGLGGVFVEVLDDVTFRVPPFDEAEARRMVAEVRGARILDGVRGRPAVDVDALVDVLLRVQRLAVEHAGTIAELDINPLVVLPRGAVALDALVVTRDPR